MSIEDELMEEIRDRRRDIFAKQERRIRELEEENMRLRAEVEALRQRDLVEGRAFGRERRNAERRQGRIGYQTSTKAPPTGAC